MTIPFYRGAYDGPKFKDAHVAHAFQLGQTARSNCDRLIYSVVNDCHDTLRSLPGNQSVLWDSFHSGYAYCHRHNIMASGNWELIAALV